MDSSACQLLGEQSVRLLIINGFTDREAAYKEGICISVSIKAVMNINYMLCLTTRSTCL